MREWMKKDLKRYIRSFKYVKQFHVDLEVRFY